MNVARSDANVVHRRQVEAKSGGGETRVKSFDTVGQFILGQPTK